MKPTVKRRRAIGIKKPRWTVRNRALFVILLLLCAGVRKLRIAFLRTRRTRSFDDERNVRHIFISTRNNEFCEHELLIQGRCTCVCYFSFWRPAEIFVCSRCKVLYIGAWVSLQVFRWNLRSYIYVHYLSLNWPGYYSTASHFYNRQK